MCDYLYIKLTFGEQYNLISSLGTWQETTMAKKYFIKPQYPVVWRSHAPSAGGGGGGGGGKRRVW